MEMNDYRMNAYPATIEGAKCPIHAVSSHEWDIRAKRELLFLPKLDSTY